MSLLAQQSIRVDVAIHLSFDPFTLELLQQIHDKATLRLVVKAKLVFGS